VGQNLTQYVLPIFKLFHMVQLEEHAIYITLFFARMLAQMNALTKADFGSVTRFIAIAVIFAQKYLDDYMWENKAWALLMGIPKDELNKLELKIVLDKEFNLYIKVQEYEHWLKQLRHYVPLLHAYKGLSECGPPSPTETSRLFSTLECRFTASFNNVVTERQALPKLAIIGGNNTSTNKMMHVGSESIAQNSNVCITVVQPYTTISSFKLLKDDVEKKKEQVYVVSTERRCIPMAIPDDLRRIWDVTY